MKVYDDNNPWHTNANLVFGFQCHKCDVWLCYEDFPVGDLDENFFEFCVGISTEAQRRGWKIVDDYEFLCPICAD